MNTFAGGLLVIALIICLLVFSFLYEDRNKQC